MFRTRYFTREAIYKLLVACVLIFVVFAFVHYLPKHTSVTQTTKDVLTNGRFGDLLMERTATSRKLLANHGLLVPTSLGTYQRILVVSTFRSGSTFTGELLSQIPGVLYNFEPFLHLITRDIPIANETFATEYVSELAKVLECDYGPSLAKYPGLEMLKSLGLGKNTVYQMCKEVESKGYCENPERLSQACQYFPIQVSKLVRIPLRYILPLLRKPELNLHVILLVRDPRGTLASRRRTGWCTGECADNKRLCGLLRDNYAAALEAANEFPEHFTLLRYEDLATDPENRSYWLLKRLGLPITPSVTQYIETHTGSKPGKFAVSAISKGSRVALWKRKLPWKDIKDTQVVCEDVFDKYGYLPIPNADTLNESQTFRPDWRLPLSVK